MFNILEMLPPLPRIKVIDIGAMSLGQGTEPYFPLMELNMVDVTGFEPIDKEYKKLLQSAPSNYRYFPYFIGNGSNGTFYECNYPMTSSLYEPNTELLSKFQNLENFVQVVKKHKVQTKRLDDIKEIVDTDLIKVDVQGGELDVFQGATKLLESAVLIQTEVEFLPLYKNQPLFADIDSHLRQHGFVFHNFAGLSGRMFKPLVDTGNINRWISQPLWSDAIYVKDFMKIELLKDEKLLKLIVILHSLYGSFDLCCMLLNSYDSRHKTKLGEMYLDRLINATK